MWPVPLVDHVEDLRVPPDVGVVMLLARRSVGSNIHFSWSTYGDEEDLCLVTH